jgi:hypothetical protein
MKKVAIGALAGGIAGGAAVWAIQAGSFSLHPSGMTYNELAALVLGGAALTVTSVGIGVAVLALWGYNDINARAEKRAQSAATEKIDAEMADGKLRRHVEAAAAAKIDAELANGNLRRHVEESATAKIDADLKDGELRRHVELVVTSFLEEGSRDGALLALLEARREEAERLRTVDAGWAELQEDTPDDK